MAQILAPEARERLARISIVKPDRARAVEDLLIRLARSGQIRQRVTEKELVQFLDSTSANDEQKKDKIVVSFFYHIFMLTNNPDIRD
jgi:programmed cell death protein 5